MEAESRGIPEQWIRQYIDKLLTVAQTLEQDAALKQAMTDRATHIMDMIAAFHETQKSTGSGT
jgi:hypothetical protein